MPKAYKLRLVGSDRRTIKGFDVTVHGGRFAVFRAPHDSLFKNDPPAWFDYARKCADQWPKDDVGMPLVMIPPGSELEVMEIVEDDGQ
jgi:hypothetical protein